MDPLHHLLDRLWEDYASLNPQAQTIHRLLCERGERVVNDHIAFRTYDDPRVGLDAVAESFVSLGYQPKGSYEFPEKKLTARHYEPPSHQLATGLPRVFISQLQVGQFSQPFGDIVASLIDQVPADLPKSQGFPVADRPWGVSYADYETLRQESEYGAWLAAFGLRANHFTVDVGALNSFDGLAAFNAFLIENGFELNTSGGAIKGSPEVFLEQSSTLAAQVPVDFSDGQHTIPGCYYEFAKRYRMPSGELFQGFIAQSASKIFESTDRRD